MPDELGTPNKPWIIKCASIGSPSGNHAYLSLVTEGGVQICLGMTFDQWRLISMQAAQVVAGWTVEPP